MENLFITILLVFAGLFSLVSSAVDWDWYFNNSRARFFVKVFGRQGARIFYGLLGATLIGLGVFYLVT